ncbi:unnamed protein product [Owenia fusiformis]|uniref:N-acyl-aliphatic-L-amino acid amidohydrolase n=1 Tax=Owenia fusiformis TaxID=6347 RepID=A0A8S4NQY3_OWEFU|nr:unnamed protein product [Owenia fusiformis]
MPEGGGIGARKVEEKAVTTFREYLRIKTVHPDPDYDGALAFLKKQASELGLPFACTELHPGKIILVMTWEGSDPSLPSILLNSHTDVVPVFPEHWKYDAFEAVKTSEGDIYARGTQDMKCVGIQYLEAIRSLKYVGYCPLRTIHLSFVPDEEIGGKLGMKLFVHHEDFKKLNVGFALDEGLANPTEKFTVFYGERSPWWIRVKCTGNPGHGSRFIENTAAEKVRKVINSFLNFREEEEKKLNTNACLKLGDVTTLNMTMLEGGVQYNVVPTELFAGFDIRVAPTVDMEQFEETIRGWLKDAGDGISYEFIQKNTDQTLTSTSENDVWWRTFSDACKKRNMVLEKEIFPAATDSRFLRELGYPAIGFSPINKTPILLHDHNEFLNEDIFMEGIPIYVDIIKALADIPMQAK